MRAEDILWRPDEATAKMITKDLGEDPDRLQKQVELFKEWLRCESYLPKDIDHGLIMYFVRMCKCDLEKAKKKFENYLLLRTKLKTYYTNRDIVPYFDQISLHRQFITCPKLTPEGYRVGLVRLLENIDHFDFMKIFHFVLIFLDFVLHEDCCAAYVAIYDLKHLSAQHLGRINLKALAEAVNLVYNVTPCRIRAMHFLNVPYVPDAMIALVKKIVPEKIVNRTYAHKDVTSLTRHIPTDVLPKEYGGNTFTCDALSENLKEFYTKNKEWERKLVNLKLRGSIPHRKRELYSFEDFEMGGSFRKLSID